VERVRYPCIAHVQSHTSGTVTSQNHFIPSIYSATQTHLLLAFLDFSLCIFFSMLTIVNVLRSYHRC
jgi:hypothetical protein